MIVDDVAAIRSVSETTVRRWCRDGLLKCEKVQGHWRIHMTYFEVIQFSPPKTGPVPMGECSTCAGTGDMLGYECSRCKGRGRR